ncbi:uncharacterized protein LOC113798334 isoform X2 [Dermatophagoides pteronyssinus]|uniref:uncharacterized protein LOC113798334 isoform X2 n=1 Tax=Dermatophagoides pteronyssinus TaxID=6956 RepID=UPI003F667E56
MFRLLLFIHNHNLLMMIGVIFTMNDVWMANGDKSFIMRGIVGKTEWDTVRYPYKSVYGLPKSLQCSDTIQHQFNECEKSSHREWKVTIDGYFYETKQFCCFVWHAMACEIEKAAKCNQNYSQQIETNTRQLFTSVCDKISSSQRSWNCFWTEDMIIIAGVVATVITILLIAVGAYLGCRQYRANAKLKAQAANKLKFSTKNLTTADTGPSTRTFRSNKIPTTTTVDHIDKPVQNVEKQGKFRKWIGKIFPSSSSSSKPNKNEKLTTKNISQSKKLKRIPSTTATRNVKNNSIDKPVELSEWNPQTPPKKINVQHVQSSDDDEFISSFYNQPPKQASPSSLSDSSLLNFKYLNEDYDGIIEEFRDIIEQEDLVSSLNRLSQQQQQRAPSPASSDSSVIFLSEQPRQQQPVPSPASSDSSVIFLSEQPRQQQPVPSPASSDSSVIFLSEQPRQQQPVPSPASSDSSVIFLSEQPRQQQPVPSPASSDSSVIFLSEQPRQQQPVPSPASSDSSVIFLSEHPRQQQQVPSPGSTTLSPSSIDSFSSIGDPPKSQIQPSPSPSPPSPPPSSSWSPSSARSSESSSSHGSSSASSDSLAKSLSKKARQQPQQAPSPGSTTLSPSSIDSFSSIGDPPQSQIQPSPSPSKSPPSPPPSSSWSPSSARSSESSSSHGSSSASSDSLAKSLSKKARQQQQVPSAGPSSIGSFSSIGDPPQRQIQQSPLSSPPSPSLSPSWSPSSAGSSGSSSHGSSVRKQKPSRLLRSGTKAQKSSSRATYKLKSSSPSSSSSGSSHGSAFSSIRDSPQPQLQAQAQEQFQLSRAAINAQQSSPQSSSRPSHLLRSRSKPSYSLPSRSRPSYSLPSLSSSLGSPLPTSPDLSQQQQQQQQQLPVNLFQQNQINNNNNNRNLLNLANIMNDTIQNMDIDPDVKF